MGKEWAGIWDHEFAEETPRKTTRIKTMVASEDEANEERSARARGLIHCSITTLFHSLTIRTPVRSETMCL